MLSTQNLELGILIMPNCQYTVRASTLNGSPVKYVKIGDRLVHRWECDNRKCNPRKLYFNIIKEVL